MQVHVSPEVNTLLNAAVEISVRRNHYFVGVEHLYDAVLNAPERIPQAFASRYGDMLREVSRLMMRDAWRGGPPSAGSEVFYTPRCAETLGEAQKLAERYRVGPASAGHLLLALFADAHSAPSRALDRLGVNRGELIADLRKELGHPQEASGGRQSSEPTPQLTDRPEPAVEKAKAPLAPLESLTRDLTSAARRGELSAAVGRSSEMFEILQVLARKGKNNVMLVGEAGVGKTQIVEGLAVATVEEGLGGVLHGKRILELSLGALMSGTQYRGAFEEKMLALLEELKQSPDTILFIDEVHLIMGAGSTDGDSMDVANLLKPALARGEIRCIGATTLQEYRRFVEKDPAMERRFQMVRVEPLGEDATLRVLKKLRPALEKHHGVHISARSLESAIRLTQRYMPNRHLPDKAIDVLDQACARYRLKSIAAQQQAAAGHVTDYHRPTKVIPHDIRKVVSQLTAIPIEEMTAQERLLLGDLENVIKARIIGQDQAVAKTVAAVKKSRAGLADPNRPQAVLLFLGPSGVGKTQLAKVLADILFGSPHHLTTFDMSEYIEEHSVSRLIGAPPGYVGGDEEGRLFAAVRHAPFSVLLFDEIEKAHHRVFDVLLPVFDEGRLRDSRGRIADFRNCIIILTSNIGADVLGHGEVGGDRARLLAELRNHFRPEFINRMDEIVPFYPLLFEDVRTILALSVRELGARIKEQGFGVRVYQQAYEYLATAGYSAEYGARELRRTLDRLVAEPLSSEILAGHFQPGEMIEVLMEEGRLTFRKGALERKSRAEAPQ